jgi:hypothetical protein
MSDCNKNIVFCVLFFILLYEGKELASLCSLGSNGNYPGDALRRFFDPLLDRSNFWLKPGQSSSSLIAIRR